MQKKYLSQKFFAPPPSDRKKIRATLFAMKITGQRRRKAYKLDF